MTPSGGLTAKQQRLLAALFESSSVRSAALAAGVPERTAYRWLAAEPFQAALNCRLDALLDGAAAALASDLTTARETLRAIMGDVYASPSARVQAAGKVLDAALRLVELRSFEQRLAAIERRLAAGDTKVSPGA